MGDFPTDWMHLVKSYVGLWWISQQLSFNCDTWLETLPLRNKNTSLWSWLGNWRRSRDIILTPRIRWITGIWQRYLVNNNTFPSNSVQIGFLRQFTLTIQRYFHRLNGVMVAHQESYLSAMIGKMQLRYENTTCQVTSGLGVWPWPVTMAS